MTNGRTALGDAIDICVAEFELLIDRHFAANRTLVVERESEKHWTASIGDVVLYRHPLAGIVLAWATTFTNRHPHIVLEYAGYEDTESYSVRVDNVVPLHA